ncbi:4Fe-4S binding protein [candidate division KSB1 bacterium]|nr:4Fe-4S binding protein [candidate division KSB1 bacterium]
MKKLNINTSRAGLFLILFIVILMIGSSAFTQNRFPKPEFESDYQQSQTTTPDPQAQIYEVMDLFVLFLMLVLATYFAHRKRSRHALFILAIVSVIYFGFWRKGCVCSVGSLQNITLALFDKSFMIPVVVVLFFALPLIFTLFFGRTFCASVCPLGTVQELVLIRPMTLPKWLSRILGLFPYLYLGLTLLFAATGAAFLICRFDPFVAFFRMNGSLDMLILGAFFLVTSTVIGRPYCRFVCPYGVLLGWMSSLSRTHVTITPDECIKCRLCENACPYDAIQKPVPEQNPENRKTGLRRLKMLLLIAPLVILTLGWTFSRLHPLLSRVHYTVRLADQIQREDSGQTDLTTLESQGFRSSGTPTKVLYDEALRIQKQFNIGGWILGGFMGLVIIWQLVGVSIIRHRKDYEIDRFSCVSCARCFNYCPREKNKKKTKVNE